MSISKNIVIGVTMLFMISGGALTMANEGKDIYQFKAKLINGKEISLADYKGMTLLIVNTASKCGFTDQYVGLEKIYETYKHKKFAVLAFPSNDFMGQEPGSNEEIHKFCQLRYNIAFPIFEKISVKGKDIHPLYLYLTKESAHKGAITWNFNKFLISSQGQVVARFGSKTAPEDPELVKAIEAEIGGRD